MQQITEAENALIKLDPVLGRLIKLQKPIIHQAGSDYFFSLCRSIIGQQVSVKAASTIFGRFEVITDVKPAKVLTLTDTDIKTIGLSRQKTSYLRDLAEHFVENPDVFSHLDTLDDVAVIKELTAIKGVGVWTAEMFLMFTLGRLDVFAPDDNGIQRAMQRLYGWTELPPKQELEACAERWRPYRTVACWHLWQSLDNTSK